MRRAATIAVGVAAFVAQSLFAFYSTYRARRDGILLLEDAIYRRDVAEAKRLIAQGVNPRARVKVSFLDRALREGDHEMTSLLLAHGALPNDNSMGGLPIEVAAQHNDVVGLRILAAAGADLSATGEGGGALRSAAAYCAAEAVDYLLAQQVPKRGRWRDWGEPETTEACARCPALVTRATTLRCEQRGVVEDSE